MPKISKAKILILATDGFEQSELEVPREKLKAAGALVHVAAPKERKDKKEIRGWKNKDWGTGVPVDRELVDASEGFYDALVLPGGQMNTDLATSTLSSPRSSRRSRRASMTAPRSPRKRERQRLPMK